MSVALAVCGTIGLMAGAVVLMLAAARKLDPTGGWPSLTPLGLVLIAAGLGLGVASAVITSAGLRDMASRRSGRGWALAGTETTGAGAFLAEPGARAVSAGAVPVGSMSAGPVSAGPVSAGPVSAGPAPARPAGGPGRDDFVWAGDPRPPEPVARPGDWERPAEPPLPDAGREDDTRAEDWLSHLRGTRVRPAHQASRLVLPEPSAAPPVAPPASYTPSSASYTPPPGGTSPAASSASYVSASYAPPVTSSASYTPSASYAPSASHTPQAPPPDGYAPPAPPSARYAPSAPPSASYTPPVAPADGYAPPAPPSASYRAPAGHAVPASHAAPPGYGQPGSHAAPPPADYADGGWQLDGSEWAEGQGHRPSTAPEIHHPAVRRRHDTGQQPAYDTGQWRAFGSNQPPPGGQA